VISWISYEFLLSSRTEQQQQINLSDQFVGCFVRELACPRHVVELGPFGAKLHKSELSLDLVDLASLGFAGFGPAVDALAIELRDANSGIGIKVDVGLSLSFPAMTKFAPTKYSNQYNVLASQFNTFPQRG
jgi:hypothetical protein